MKLNRHCLILLHILRTKRVRQPNLETLPLTLIDDLTLLNLWLSHWPAPYPLGLSINAGTRQTS